MKTVKLRNESGKDFLNLQFKYDSDLQAFLKTIVTAEHLKISIEIAEEYT